MSGSSVVNVRGVPIGGNRVVVIAGPCAVESLDQTMKTAQTVKSAGATLLRGGSYKPRTSPRSFQGLGLQGLLILDDARDKTGLGVVSEMTSPDQTDVFSTYVDMIQIGTRNMHNYELLKAAARTGLPILLKRGFASTLEEWLGAAEYILHEGNRNVVLCERGIRTFSTHSRFTLDLSVMLAAREITDMPIIVDPSHPAGIRTQVPGLGLAAIAAGADGLLVEVHCDPQHALCDGSQSLTPEGFAKFMSVADKVATAVNRSIF